MRRAHAGCVWGTSADRVDIDADVRFMRMRSSVNSRRRPRSADSVHSRLAREASVAACATPPRFSSFCRFSFDRPPMKLVRQSSRVPCGMLPHPDAIPLSLLFAGRADR
ncbi:hypothetical protein C9I57_22060 [Trinickia symbiotica]|uniref:Uncharacterized protein n=1 Tax=Trinickia symbiotica TaxID=863227 RepID=A0A2T3XQ88_9BURK|nr:hypothetical protein C9I57_22060 [Trinickia symbiotica]